eukprot:SAG11_NODE_2945_length_2820_cov_2.401323_3_plen_67_part_00
MFVTNTTVIGHCGTADATAMAFGTRGVEYVFGPAHVSSVQSYIYHIAFNHIAKTNAQDRILQIINL